MCIRDRLYFPEQYSTSDGFTGEQITLTRISPWRGFGTGISTTRIPAGPEKFSSMAARIVMARTLRESENRAPRSVRCFTNRRLSRAYHFVFARASGASDGNFLRPRTFQQVDGLQPLRSSKYPPFYGWLEDARLPDQHASGPLGIAAPPG